MKNRFKNTMGFLIYLFAGSALFISCASPAGQVKKSTPMPEWKRYEDKLVGFSVKYDAEKFNKDPGPVGPFVFMRESAEGTSSLGLTVGPYPPGTALPDTAGLITGSLPGLIPGLIIDQINNQQIIKLTDGTPANYFELEGNIGELKLKAAFVATIKYDRLIVLGASDTTDGPLANLKAMVTSLRLDVDVDEAALRARGLARDGTFVRTDTPAFTLKYPKTFQNRRLQTNQVFRAGIPQGSPSISIAIWSLTAGQGTHKQLKAMAEGYANSLKSVGSGIKIISQNPIKIYKPYDAYQIQIAWRYRGQDALTTLVHVIAKTDKAILLAGHTIYSTDELIDIFKTINLKP